MDHWEEILCNGIARDEGPTIFDYVLFVPASEIITVWETIKSLTVQSQLGYRSTMFPDSMLYEVHQSQYFIFLETPEKRKDEVMEILRQHQLDNYIQMWRSNSRRV